MATINIYCKKNGRSVHIPKELIQSLEDLSIRFISEPFSVILEDVSNPNDIVSWLKDLRIHIPYIHWDIFNPSPVNCGSSVSEILSSAVATIKSSIASTEKKKESLNKMIEWHITEFTSNGITYIKDGVITDAVYKTNIKKNSSSKISRPKAKLCDLGK
jgi:hypothetical protein